MFKKLFVFILAGALSLGAVGCSFDSSKKDADKYTTTVEAESFYIPSEASGKVTDLSIEQGSEVKARDKVAQIDTKVYEIQKHQADSNLTLAELKKDALPSKASSNAKDQANTLVDQAKEAVDLAQLQIDKCSIVSLNGGTVSEVLIHKGEMAASGMNIAKVMDLKNKYIKVYIEEEKRSAVKLGSTVSIYDNDAKAYEGKITYIAPESEFTPKNVETKSDKQKTVFEVKIKLDENNSMSPGTLVEVEIK